MIVETTTGRVRGAAVGEVTAFRGIPYARAQRFAPPRPTLPWSGVRDALAPGPAAPQPPSRLENVMGPFEIRQSEDCLSLNIWAPRGSGHPVLIFVHGGGFSSGSGGLACYDGAELAARGDLVVVTVNYRLGALGFLRLPGVSDGNMGLLDQLSALRWVRDNIAAFGGDPENVTVAGQSAGAMSILALLSGQSARGLFHRAILQSTPAGMRPDGPDEAARTGAMLLRELGIEPGAACGLTDVPVADLLAAQVGVARRKPPSPVPPFQLVTDTLVAPDPVATVGARGADGVRILIGTTHDEAAAFFPDDRTTAEAITVQMFTEPTRRLARLLTAHAAPPWLYSFDWYPADSPFRACHCIELPFVLGNSAAWRHAPMLRGQHPSDLVDEVRDSWIGFARTGGPGWPRGTTHRFTQAVAPVELSKG
ncbi:carboxylesterase family protein [Nocardia sp. NBC_00565]|uniref:carboxylesterase/lipase family protein n=1 Tax=Nocardia sp. NBC_00565 TaxID=2975993 RepID=UPI002E815DAC|nr:carboxylesterase family protein [Nocardia sp. NBC_00565]WUC07411.1 carboxylesterase family protein [Nocardia sp. NBC_00565]